MARESDNVRIPLALYEKAAESYFGAPLSSYGVLIPDAFIEISEALWMRMEAARGGGQTYKSMHEEKEKAKEELEAEGVTVGPLQVIEPGTGLPGWAPKSKFARDAAGIKVEVPA